jgi:cytochrome c oxidase subunit IV
MTSDHGHSAAHTADHGPKTKVYLLVAFILTVITAVEVAVYYIDPIKNSAIFVPLLLVMSAVKFFTVVAFYMHLKYDHKIFRALFVGPFIIAIGTIIALIFLFAYEAK